MHTYMKAIYIFLLLLSISLTSCGQNKYPGPIEIRKYNIGQKVDTTLFKNLGALYFPNHLDGWTMGNAGELPKKYKGLPIAIWQLKSDSSIVLTLLENIVLNITVSYMTSLEKTVYQKLVLTNLVLTGNQNLMKKHILCNLILLIGI